MATVAEEQETLEEPAAKDMVGILAEFSGPHELINAAKKVNDAGFSKYECYSPFPVHGIDDAMGTKPTILPWITIAAACLGCATAFGLQWFTNGFDYKYIISGKPMSISPANIPVAFELSILFAAIATLLGMLALNGLPKLYNPLHRVDIFRGVTQDKFFLAIETADPQFNEGKVRQFIEKINPVSVTDYYESTESRQIPQIFYSVILTLAIVALIPPVVIAQMWAIPSNKPRIHPIQDMDMQPKLKTQRASNMFADGRGMRPPIPGTIPRGELQADSVMYRGLKSGEKTDQIPTSMLLPNALNEDGKPVDLKPLPWADDYPIEVSEKTINRGQGRYQIYCAPCHGVKGYGQGLITQQAMTLMTASKASWVPPVSFHASSVKSQPVGQIFNTITHGVRKMPSYGAQITPEDRWAIVLYIQALQLSQDASKDDVPESEVDGMKEIELAIPAPPETPQKKDLEGSEAEKKKTESKEKAKEPGSKKEDSKKEKSKEEAKPEVKKKDEPSKEKKEDAPADKKAESSDK